MVILFEGVGFQNNNIIPGRQIEDELMRRMLKETQERVRLFEENQRRWQQDQMQTQQQSVVRG